MRLIKLLRLAMGVTLAWGAATGFARAQETQPDVAATAAQDHIEATDDHERAASDHGQAGADHVAAAQDHGRASSDHSQVTDNLGLTATDHSRAEADRARAAKDHDLAEKDHKAHVATPQANTANVIAGGSDLWHLPKDRAAVVALAEWIDGCLYPQAEGPDPALSCVAQASRAAARRYRRIAGYRSWESEATTLGATTGFSVLAVSAGHAAKDTLGAWSAATLVPLVVDEVAAPGPRARLYTVAATAMTLVTSRAEALDAAATRMDKVLNSDQGSLRSEIEGACSKSALEVLDQVVADAGGKSPKTTYAKASARLSDLLAGRCAELIQSALKLESAALLWGLDQSQSARALGTDTIALDDAVTRLDRQTLSPSRSAITAVFGAAFALPGKLTGTAAPAEFTGRNLAVFTTTFTFNLARAPDIELPASISSAPLTAPEGIDVEAADAKIADLNRLGARLNNALAAARYFKTINERSVLSLNPGSLDQPVVLSNPTRP